ncbi:hypothetical protein BC567DRAFT_193593 [Phyllosticta citribraziliensis]
MKWVHNSGCAIEKTANAQSRCSHICLSASCVFAARTFALADRRTVASAKDKRRSSHQPHNTTFGVGAPTTAPKLFIHITGR